MRIYIACSLTYTPRHLFQEYANFIHALAETLRASGVVKQVKYAFVSSDPQLATKPFEERARLCYAWDKEMVDEADLIIADASFPSTGLGIELQIAEQNGTPIILCFNATNNKSIPISYTNPDTTKHDLQIGEGYVSLMALGIPNIFRVIQYLDVKDGITKILDAVNLFSNPAG